MQEGTCWASLLNRHLWFCGTGKNEVFKWWKRNWMFSNVWEHTWSGHWLYFWSDLQLLFAGTLCPCHTHTLPFLEHAKSSLTSGPLQVSVLSARNSAFWLAHTLHSLDRPSPAVLNLFKPYSLSLHPALISLVALTLPHIILSFYVLSFITFLT